jgi:hypothetical protein
MYQAAEAQTIAGLTKNQLREWSGRRAILSPDVPGKGRGRHALYSWSTVLVLRIFAKLQADFHIEVGCYGGLLGALRDDLRTRGMLGLYGRVLVLESHAAYAIEHRRRVNTRAALVVDLDEHLREIESLLSEGAPAQFPLFPAVSA